MWSAEPLYSRAALIAWGALFLTGASGWSMYAAGGEAARAWQSLLSGFLFFVCLGGGLAVWPAIVSSCNGRWHHGVERLAACGNGFAFPSLMLLALLWVGSSNWSPWYGVEHRQGWWLDNNLVFVRDLASLGMFWWLARRYRERRRSGGARLTGAVLVAVYGFVFSLLGFDLVMALDPHWYSTLAGGYFFISGLYIAAAGWALLAALSPSSRSDERHDLGRLVLCFSLMTTYLMYAHLLPIWYENLPNEVRFPLRRMIPPWRTVSILLLSLVYLGPLAMLLTERAKRSRLILGAVATIILIGMLVERWWLIAPTLGGAGRIGVIELSTGAALAGLFGLAATVGPGRAFRAAAVSGRGE